MKPAIASSSRIQSDSSDVFNNQSDDSKFQLITNKFKQNLSSTSPSENKKNKTVFTSSNKYTPLTTNDVNDIDIENEQLTHTLLPPPILACGNLIFIELEPT